MKKDESEINVCDIGGRGGRHRSWADFLLPVSYLSFDADPEERSRLEDESGADKSIKYVSGAISGSVGRRKFYLYDDRYLSSLYELNNSKTYRYGSATLESIIEIDTIDLDTFILKEDLNINFLSIDAQGASLEILQGATNCLSKCLAIRCELEFFQLYKDAPLAGEVLTFLHREGFNLMRMEMCGSGAYGISTEMNSYSISPWDAKPSSCDAIFLNSSLLDNLLNSDFVPSVANEIAYLVAFSIYNGVGYYGLEVIREIWKKGKLEEMIALLSPSVANPLIALCGVYLSLPRQVVITQTGENVDRGFKGFEEFETLFCRSDFEVDKVVKDRITQLYAQRF